MRLVIHASCGELPSSHDTAQAEVIPVSLLLQELAGVQGEQGGNPAAAFVVVVPDSISAPKETRS